MKRFLFFLLLIPAVAHAKGGIITGRYDDADTAVINRKFRDLEQAASRASIQSTLQSKAGTFTSSGSTGNQSITGLGFKPRAVILALGVGASDVLMFGLGWGTPSTQVSVIGGRAQDTAGANIGALSTNTTIIIRWTDANGTALGQASLVSMDNDGFTLNWSIAQAQTISYLAFQ